MDADRAGQRTERQGTEKLHKALADRGFGSRRQLETWIAAGRVRVNGAVANLGDRVAPDDTILVDGRKLADPRPAATKVLLLNKPAGVIVSRQDPQGRASVFDDLPRLPTGRWIAVGRLDLQTSGLLLLTNRGDLAHKLTHPSSGIDREYAVRVSERLGDDAVATLRTGVPVQRARERFSDVRYYDGKGANHWYHVVIMEGRNREVRRLFAAVGARVTRLKRVRYGPVILPPWLPRGARCELGPGDVTALRALLGMAAPARRDRPPARDERSVLIPYPRLPLANSASVRPGSGAGRPKRRQHDARRRQDVE